MSQPPPVPPQPGGSNLPQHPPYPQRPLWSADGAMILTLGILSLLFCCLLGPVAVILGHRAVGAIDRGEADPKERGSANTGRVFGIISTVFLALILLLILVASVWPGGKLWFAGFP